MTSYARLKPFYVSMAVRNYGTSDVEFDATSDPDTTIYAKATTQFNQPIVDKASDFVIAVERMELSTNSIPFYDASDNTVDHTIVIRSRAAIPEVTYSVAIDKNAYSLPHLLQILNVMEYKNPNTNAVMIVTFSLTEDGFLYMSLPPGETFTNQQFEFPRRLNTILGISTAEQKTATSECQSKFPRIDLGDELDHLILRTDLPTYSDALGNEKLSVLTDFAPPTNYSNGLGYAVDGSLVGTSFSTNIRQKIIYTPTERRYLELVGDFPITNITIEVYYVNQEKSLKRATLPLGGAFEIKLGFYLRQ